MGNGIDFRKLSMFFRAKLTTAQSELAVLNEYIELLTADLAWSENDSRDQSKELAALREELAKYKDGFFQRVTDEDLKKISDFVGDRDLPMNSFFMRADAWNLANMTMHMVREVQSLRIGLTAAEQRNAAILGKQTKCKECGSDALFWFALNTARNGIQQGRLNTSDVTCVLVLGCNDCSATLKTVSADRFAERMTAALKPTESGASE